MNFKYDVSIILVNYKTHKLVYDVIKSIRLKSSGFSYEIIVVDNSADQNEFQKLVSLEANNIKIINAKENLGFGKANNLGASSARGKYLYFLNTDTLLMNNAIYELIDFLNKNDKVGIVGSNLYNIYRKPNHSFIPFEKNLKGERKIGSFLTTINKKIFHKRMDFNYSKKPKKIKGYVCGASLMIRRECFEKLGGFDKDIFMYAEESLLCYRLIHELKKDVYNIPSSKVIHFEGGSDTLFSEKHFKMMADGNYIYYSKIFGKEIAVRYLKEEIKRISNKAKIAKLLNKKETFEKFKNYKNAYVNKLKEVG